MIEQDVTIPEIWEPGEQPKDYLLKITIKNNLLYKAMLAKGIRSADELERATGINSQTIRKYLALSAAPFTKRTKPPTLKKTILKIALFLDASPLDLFPEQHWTEPLPQNTVEAEASLDEIQQCFEPPKTPYDFLEMSETSVAVDRALSLLPPKIEKILRMRMGFDGPAQTLEEIGQHFTTSGERIRQLEAKGLRILRGPAVRVKLKDFDPRRNAGKKKKAL